MKEIMIRLFEGGNIFKDEQELFLLAASIKTKFPILLAG
jgi:hypothetical protein